MIKHLSKYLTSDNPSLREWVKSRINRTDQKYEVIEGNIQYVPKENQYICGTVDIYNQKLKSLNRIVLYCEKLDCQHNKLTSLPNLPVCRELICNHNQLMELPKLPVCKVLLCSDNQLTSLPELPVCERLICSNNQLTKLPNPPVCVELYCKNNPLTELPNLPVCKTLLCDMPLYYQNNSGYPFNE